MLVAQLLCLLFLEVSAMESYTPVIAKQMAYLSSIAYENANSIDSWTCADCWRYPLVSVKVFKDGSNKLQGYTGYSQRRGILVVFRGSENIQNWITDLEAKKIDYSRCKNCKVHDGFYIAWQSLANIVMQQVQELRRKYTNAPISVTGHSLGAAIATLAAVDLKNTFGQIKYLYTFGEPRVGNQQFAAFFETVASSIRVVHYADLVPHLPWASSGFLHQGIEVWYDKSMSEYIVCLPGQSASCSNSLPFYDYGIKDHHISIYVTLPDSFESLAKKLFGEWFLWWKEWLSGKIKGQNLSVANQ